MKLLRITKRIISESRFDLLSPVPNSVHTVDYCGNYIYEDNTLKQIMIDGGYITFTNNQPIYHFYIQDHLGNIRVVADQSGVAEQVNHYYPYGGIIADISTNQDIQRHKYNGKEYDRMYGLNLYDYGARHYDPATLAWTTADPLAEKYYPNTLYGYCADNPVNLIDIGGAMLGDYYNENGTWLGSDGKKDDYAYLADEVVKDKSGKVIGSDNYVLLPFTNSVLLKLAAVAYSESDAKKYSKEEIFGIASASMNNYNIRTGKGKKPSLSFYPKSLVQPLMEIIIIKCLITHHHIIETIIKR